LIHLEFVPTLAADVNLGGTVNLLEAARTCGLRRFVLASSTTLYYPTFRRPQASPVAEDFAFHSVSERPASLYAASKLAAEFFTQHYADQFGLSVAILRYSAVLGLWAGPNNSVPGRLLATLLGRGAVNGRVSVTDPLLLWSGGDDFIDARDVAASQHLRPSLIFDKVVLPGTGFAGFPYQRTQAFDVRCAKKELGFSAQHDLLSSFKAASAWVSSN
jgi:UDP-glucose 4-epimerase